MSEGQWCLAEFDMQTFGQVIIGNHNATRGQLAAKNISKATGAIVVTWSEM